MFCNSDSWDSAICLSPEPCSRPLVMEAFYFLYGPLSLFTGVRGRRVLGSSLSSGAARRRLRVRHEAPEDGVGDAPLEAPQRLLAGLALRDLLAVVGSAPSVRPGLAYGDHVQGVVEPAIPGQREPVAHHLPAGGFHGCRATLGGEVVGLGREARHVAYPVPMILAASMGPTPKISVRAVPEASTSASMRPLRSSIFRSSVLTSRSTSEPISGSTAASRPLREAATRRWRGHRAHRSCGRCRSRAPAPVPRAWAARPPHTRRPLPASPPGDDRGNQSSPPPNDARQTVSPSIHKGPQAGAVLREASTLEELASDFVDRSDGDRRLVRIDPDQDLHERRHLRFGRTSAMGAKDIPTLSGVPIPLLDRRGAICS